MGSDGDSIVTHDTAQPLAAAISGFTNLKIDTDPENMLSETEPARVFHNDAKKEFSLHEMVIVRIVNEEHPNGVFNTAYLMRIFKLIELLGS